MNLDPTAKEWINHFGKKGGRRGGGNCLQARFTRKLFLPLPHALVVNSAMSPRWRCLIADVPTARRSRRGNGSQHTPHCGHIMIPNKTWFWLCSLQDGFTRWGCCDVVTPKRLQRLRRLKILSQEQWSILINTTLGYIQRSAAAARHLLLIPLYLILIWINRSSQFPLWHSAN